MTFYDKIRNASGNFKVCLTTSGIAICEELSDHASEDENFLKRIITSDETWVDGYDVEMKMQSSQWVGKNSLRLKRVQRVMSNVKVMLTFFFLTSRVLCVINSYIRGKQ
jgi:hypothetical protein